MSEGFGQLAVPLDTIDGEREREIAALIEPGLAPNAWRPDFERLRQRRLWDELHQGPRLRALDRAFPSLRGKRILDIGTGRGGLAVALRRHGCEVVGLDLRRRNCRITRLRAQRYGLDVPVVQGRAERLPFGNERVDVVICRDVLEHVDGPSELLVEIHRVLRRGGACFITVINRYCWIDPHYHLAGLSFLPRAWAEWYVARRGRAKESGRDRQRIFDMNYFTYGGFLQEVQRLGFGVDDLRWDELQRDRADGVLQSLRWLRYAMLRPFSLHADQFEFLLSKMIDSPRGQSA